MQCQHASQVLLGATCYFVGDFEFKDGRWVDDAAISFTEAACSCRGGLLSDDESVVERWRLRHAREGVVC